ncbi:hypothetical protein ACFFGQ_16170 [Rufibacter quisquiliarum]|uniref:Uncharacterized protein n=1 Tax=Rufibacter quisquiliarum TaxID=1549639 RepID=A0A839GQU5_9BACT|nr:hypothetical protein [Rufibacter quisquiliarum]
MGQLEYAEKLISGSWAGDFSGQVAFVFQCWREINPVSTCIVSKSFQTQKLFSGCFQKNSPKTAFKGNSASILSLFEPKSCCNFFWRYLLLLI